VVVTGTKESEEWEGEGREERVRKKNERDKFNNINTLCGLLLKTVQGKGKKITIIELDVCEGVVVRATLETADKGQGEEKKR